LTSFSYQVTPCNIWEMVIAMMIAISRLLYRL
jgi:hypothetical protein